MYADTVTIYRATHEMGRQGDTRVVYPAEGEEMAASVQKSTVGRVDGQGRIYSDTRHTVRTAEDPNVGAGDKIQWLDHPLIVEGHAEPGGIKEEGQPWPTWITQCQEVR
jgi:hypothetical protein